MTNQETQAPVVLGVTCLFWSLAVTIVALRLYARSRVVKFLGADDWWMAAAIIFSTLDQSLKISWCLHGLGKHINDVDQNDMAVFLKLSYVVPVQYPFALGAVKMSILNFYLRVFPQKQFRKVCFVVFGIIIASTLSVAFGQAFACTPISDGWKAVPTGYCVNRQALQVAGSVINLSTDLLVLLLPMKYLYSIVIDKKRRYGIIALFSLGLITCVASAYRLSTIPGFYASSDKTWGASSLCIWSAIEINLSIITASIPAIKALITNYISNPLKELVSGSSKHYVKSEDDKWELVNRLPQKGEIHVRTEMDFNVRTEMDV